MFRNFGGISAYGSKGDVFLQDCDVYLLDDVLAAVDASVAALLWDRAICGMLRSKTRLVDFNTLPGKQLTYSLFATA